jgi:hypothetical protein
VEYQDKIKESGDNHFMRLRAAEWLLDASERIVSHAQGDCQQVLEGSVRNEANSA